MTPDAQHLNKNLPDNAIYLGSQTASRMTICRHFFASLRVILFEPEILMHGVNVSAAPLSARAK
jgi:hypothetical protein